MRGRSIYDFVLEDDRQALKNYLRVAAQQMRVKPITVRCQDKAERPCDVEIVCRRLPEKSWLGRGWVGLARPKPDPHDGLSAGELELRPGCACAEPTADHDRDDGPRLRPPHPVGGGGSGGLLEAAEQVARQAERAAEIIRRLRDLVTEGKRYSTPTDLNELVQESIQLLRADIEKAQVAILSSAWPRTSRRSCWTASRSARSWSTWPATPSRRCTRPRSPTARSRCDGPRGDEVVVSVSDRGGGLSVEMVSRLFEPFQTTKPHGMGVGLALCRSIVQAHGGRIAARPNGDRGTTFFFSLPQGREKP